MSSIITETVLEDDQNQHRDQGRIEYSIHNSLRPSVESFDLATPTTGAQTPDPLVRRNEVHGEEVIKGLEQISTQRSGPHMGDAMENLARSRKYYQLAG